MTVSIGIYDQEGTVNLSIRVNETGETKDRAEIHKRIANMLEASAYETVRKLVTNNEIPEAIIQWDSQKIRVRNKDA